MKKVLPMKSFFDKRGRRRRFGALDEWLSQRSAKPSTAVRIRHAPLFFLEKSEECRIIFHSSFSLCILFSFQQLSESEIEVFCSGKCLVVLERVIAELVLERWAYALWLYRGEHRLEFLLYLLLLLGGEMG